MQKKRLHIWVSGRVQGVFYRARTVEMASALGLTGWVRNLPDGRVEIVAEGDEPDLQELLEWCRQGPPMARVQEVRVEEEPYGGEFDDFSVHW